MVAACSGWASSAFLSTLPAWGATGPVTSGDKKPIDFYPRSPRGERPLNRVVMFVDFEFLSTLPAWGATGSRCASV